MADQPSPAQADLMPTSENPSTVPMDPRRQLLPSTVRDFYMRGSHALRKAQYDYALNRAFLDGDQWLYYDEVRSTIRSLPRDPSRTRVIINRLWPTSRHLLAKLLSRELVFEVPPQDSDDASIRGAHTAEAVITDIHKQHGWEDHRENLAWATWLGGTSVFALDWDPSKGPTLGSLPTSGKPFGTGDITESVLNICEVAWEPGTRDAERGKAWVRAQALPPDEVREMFHLDYTPKADATALVSPATQKLLSDGKRGTTFVPLTLVLTYYERPNNDRPEGAVATLVGDKFVDGPKPWPFPFKDRLNMVVIRETKIPGQAHGTTVVSAAVPVQVAYNASWSTIIEHMKLAGNARLLVPEASVDGIEDLTDLPSEIISYNNVAGAPSFLSPPQMPQWWIDQPDRLASQMDDILGLHDTSRGAAPTNVDSGVGLSVLVEQDATPLGKLTREMASAFERIAHMALEIYVDKVKETRKAKISHQSVPETVNWTGVALQGQTDVIIPIDAVMPRSHAAMFAMAQNLWDRKIISTPEQFTQISQIPGQENLLDSIDRDASKARRENDLLSMDQACVPASFDNHATHIAKHNEFRKSSRYESLPEPVQQLIDTHIQAHETLAAEEAGLQVAKANAHPVLPTLPTGSEAAPLPAGVPMSPGEAPPIPAGAEPPLPAGPPDQGAPPAPPVDTQGAPSGQ